VLVETLLSALIAVQLAGRQQAARLSEAQVVGAAAGISTYLESRGTAVVAAAGIRISEGEASQCPEGTPR
tara:strand:- start:67 stop:276 length:210 start_codon:yes stop_codon:yes gene_type:complete